MPGVADAHILLHRQTIEPFIGEDQDRLIRGDLFQLIDKDRRLRCKLLREPLSQDRARFDEMKVRRFDKARSRAGGPQCI